MKDKFKSYYKPTNEEFDEMWNNGIIAFDANVLLNFYRYSEKTNQLFFEILEKAKQRIWIPNQSVHEYFENRLYVIDEGLRNYSKIQKKLKEFCYDIEKELAADRKQPFINNYEDLLNKLKLAVKNLEEKLNNNKDNFEKLFVSEDYIMLSLTELLDGKVGDPYSNVELRKLYKLAKDRFDNFIPPGYKDYQKKKNKYGDYILWRQLIDYASVNKKDIIFVSDEKKDDWWYQYKNKNFGPRVELRSEMYEVAGVNFYMYSPELFLKHSKKYFKIKVDKESITEVAEASKKTEEIEKIIRREIALKALSDLAIKNIPSEEQLERMRETFLSSIPSEEQLERMRETFLSSIPSEEQLERIRESFLRSIPSEEQLERMRNNINKIDLLKDYNQKFKYDKLDEKYVDDEELNEDEESNEDQE